MGATKVDSWYGNIVVSILIQLILHRLRTTQLYPRMYGKLRNAPSVVFLNWDRIITMNERRMRIRKLPCRHDTSEAYVGLSPLIQRFSVPCPSLFFPSFQVNVHTTIPNIHRKNSDTFIKQAALAILPELIAYSVLIPVSGVFCSLVVLSFFLFLCQKVAGSIQACLRFFLNSF